MSNSDTYDIFVLDAEGRDITQRFVNHPSIDGWAGGPWPRNGLPSLNELTEGQATVVAAQLIDSGHEWGTVDPDPLYAQAKSIINGTGRGTLMVPDGWVIHINKVDDMTRAHRRDNRDKNKADALRRAIADYLADPPERSVLSSEEGIALENIGAKLIKFSDHIVAVWN